MRDGQLSCDAKALLEAFRITLAMVSDPVARYAYTLTEDGVELVARLFQTTMPPATVNRIIPTDTPETAQMKYREWLP
ncbi:hypothetical protein [Mesorhizobium sp.]|uniref:hypothetical protein n=1 Tax=Mesorhizobium sp. TaxID=1871066 RepID=UPI000FD349D2|nr:hypothetical protein [Mesorhizobium sp.]RVC63982.1 hypothetical protein EN779_03285 [Mesorhizobium sp. M4B.F.Ca.ET.088.02.2.1]RWF32437.1 MAG: hypothetical protein EOS45_06890 [Mesorhizobium sp.]